MSKVIIFPDIHGRKFWKPIFNQYKNDPQIERFIFLGDYLDPYDFEHISRKEAIDNFIDILNNIRENDVLLLGNHDLHYFPPIDKWPYGPRRDNSNKRKIQQLFLNNKRKFKISYTIANPNGKDWVFSHAGFLKSWFKQVKMFFDKELTIDNVNDLLNSHKGREILNMVGPSRGGYNREAPSCLWADHSDHYEIYDRFDDIYQIFGHTITSPDYGEWEINEEWAMLDSSRAFIMDLDTGIIEPLPTNLKYIAINKQNKVLDENLEINDYIENAKIYDTMVACCGDIYNVFIKFKKVFEPKLIEDKNIYSEDSTINKT